jgi:hypothetical protein
MGVKPPFLPSHANGFFLPSYGPKRADFWKEPQFQTYLITAANDPDDFFVSTALNLVK